MTFRCNDCFKTIRTVKEVRDCYRCRTRGQSATIPQTHSDSDWLTPAIIGYMVGSSFSHDHNSAPTPAYEGAGGESGGGGASASWDSGSSPSSDSGSSYSSSDSSNSSSDSGSSSSDSSSSSSGSAD